MEKMGNSKFSVVSEKFPIDGMELALFDFIVKHVFLLESNSTNMRHFLKQTYSINFSRKFVKKLVKFEKK
jgi:hypothetical protein